MSDEPMNQDRRVKRTRQVIRDAFISLIGQKGFEAVTVQEITETADIHRSTFYFHYEDKYDLMKQINEEMFQAFGHALSLPEAEAGEQCRFSWDWPSSVTSSISPTTRTITKSCWAPTAFPVLRNSFSG